MIHLAPIVPADNHNGVAPFEPARARENDAKADALIEFAQRLHDWPLLESAVEAKMQEQAEFVVWWRENVRPDGRPPKTGAERGRFLRDDAEAQTGISHQQVSKWAKRLQDRAKYRDVLYGAAYRKAMAEKGQTDLRGASGTGENEWYTPAPLLDAARDVLGTIDLDPASSAKAQEIVKAAAFYSKEDSGLLKEWYGRVWLNPPYAQPLIAEFVNKMVVERSAGNVSAGIMLTHNYTDTAWFHSAVEVADAICFTRGRVKFYDDSGAVAAPTQGQAFFYFGPDTEAFAARFSDLGFVCFPWRGEVA